MVQEEEEEEVDDENELRGLQNCLTLENFASCEISTAALL